MELTHTIIEELKLREQGKRGKLENLSNVELLCLAHDMKIKSNPQPSEKLRE